MQIDPQRQIGASPQTQQQPATTLTQILWKARLTIAAAAVIGLAGGAGAILLTKRIYRAHTSLLLEGFNEQAVGSVNPVSPLPASAVDYLQNEVKVLESDTLARRVAKQLGSDVAVIAGKPDLPLTDQQRVRTISKAISVRTGMQSQVMEIFFDAPDPALAARGANAITTEFINMSREARWQMVQDTTEWLNRQAAELKARLDSLNGRLQDFTAGTGLILGGPQGTPVEDRARQLQDAFTRAQADRAAKQARYEAITASPNETTEGVGASPLQQYQTELQTLRKQLADLRTMYQPDNYRITRLEAQVAATEAAIRHEQAAIRDRMRNDYLAAASLERMLSGSLQTQLAKVQQQTQRDLQYNVLKNEVDTTQKLYDSVMEKAKEAGAESSLRITNIRVIDGATPPTRPYAPNIPFDLAMGLGLGAVAGATLVLFRAGSSRIRHPGELTALALPELGVVPRASGRLTHARASLAAADVGALTPESSLVWDSFRSVLISVLFRVQESENQAGAIGIGGRVLVVGSAEMMEGKTTVVTNLGIASAQHQRKVLLIDADFRRPRLHERFGISNDRGLSDLLMNVNPAVVPDELLLDAFATRTSVPGLSVMTAGSAAKEAANLLYSSNLKAILQRLVRNFDLIFIDTPPLAMYPEARVLGRMSHGMVMVVRANSRSAAEMHGIYQKLIEDRIPVLGMVLNHWKVGRAQARAYSRYYSHYQTT